MPPERPLDDVDVDAGSLPQVLWRSAGVLEERRDASQEAARPLFAVEFALTRLPEDEAWRRRSPS